MDRDVLKTLTVPLNTIRENVHTCDKTSTRKLSDIEQRLLFLDQKGKYEQIYFGSGVLELTVRRILHNNVDII